jgi:hypothetical protein
MNDIYKLDSADGKNFIWEEIKLLNPKIRPDVRSGFGGCCFID